MQSWLLTRSLRNYFKGVVKKSIRLPEAFLLLHNRNPSPLDSFRTSKSCSDKIRGTRRTQSCSSFWTFVVILYVICTRIPGPGRQRVCESKGCDIDESHESIVLSAFAKVVLLMLSREWRKWKWSQYRWCWRIGTQTSVLYSEGHGGLCVRYFSLLDANMRFSMLHSLPRMRDWQLKISPSVYCFMIFQILHTHTARSKVQRPGWIRLLISSIFQCTRQPSQRTDDSSSQLRAKRWRSTSLAPGIWCTAVIATIHQLLLY